MATDESMVSGERGMTSEEAIKTLKGEAWLCCAEKWNEALNMAIKALEQEPSSDAISRDAVRHILNHEVKLPIKAWKKFFELVDDLPSVQPKQRTGRWIDNKNGTYTCDSCGCKHSRSNFCPDCGFRIVEPRKSEE